MRGQLWSREELMEKYGIPEGDQRGEEEGDDDEDAAAAGSGAPDVPPPMPAQRGGGAGDALAAARLRAAQGLRSAAAQARGLLAVASRVRHAWQDTKWARDLWRALRRQRLSQPDVAEQEL